MRKQADNPSQAPAVDIERRTFLQWALCATAALGLGAVVHRFSNFSLQGVVVELEAWRARPGASLPLSVHVQPQDRPRSLSAHLVEVDPQGRVVRTLAPLTHAVKLPSSSSSRTTQTTLRIPRLELSQGAESYLLAVVVCDDQGHAALSNAVEVIATPWSVGA